MDFEFWIQGVREASPSSSIQNPKPKPLPLAHLHLCTVVAGRSVSMAGFQWFVAENSGLLAEKDDCKGHASALEVELAAWRDGRRDFEGVVRTIARGAGGDAGFEASRRWKEQILNHPC